LPGIGEQGRDERIQGNGPSRRRFVFFYLIYCILLIIVFTTDDPLPADSAPPCSLFTQYKSIQVFKSVYIR